VIIHNLDVVRFRFDPAETDSQLVVNSNAVLTSAAATQGFQTVRRNSRLIVQLRSCMQLIEPSLGDPRNCLKPPAELAAKHLRGFLAPEGTDHKLSVSRLALYAMR